MENVGIKKAEQIKVSVDVIKTIVKLSALEVKGVEDVVCDGSFLDKILSRNKDEINIDILEGVLIISLAVKVKFGNKIPVIAEKIQNNVKASVQGMLSVSVAKVNVRIADVIFDETEN